MFFIRHSDIAITYITGNQIESFFSQKTVFPVSGHQGEKMDFSIKTLGKCRYKSPLIDNYSKLQTAFVDESTRVRLNVLVDGKDRDDPTLELAGQRREIYFNPPYTRAAIVTCGGLCPGLNDVIRSIVMESHYHYGINSILGIRYGYNGLKNFKEYPPVELTPEVVKDIHTIGGTILGSSRGGTDNIDDLVDALEHMGINILFAIGGDGTLNGQGIYQKGPLKEGFLFL